MRQALLVALLVAVASGCKLTTEPTPETSPRTRRTSWPGDWVGTWHGTLHLEGNLNMDPIPFELEIGPAEEGGERRWRLGYDDAPARDYRLITRDAAAGLYAIDEQNGIVLEARLVGDTLVSVFAVGQQILVTSQRFLEDRIEHEILTFSRASASTGRDVDTHAVMGRQHAALRELSNQSS
ncbi:MAG: hypothetical protein AAGG01_00065 [Planctomycetota bacterium]